MADSVYQERYVEHQARKGAQLSGREELEAHPITPLCVVDALENRRSQRIFTTEPIADYVLERMLEAACMAPSSCNRHGIKIKVVQDRYEKNVLAGLLVGATGWAHRAGALFLFLADKEAYASPNERDFMHYCDVGFTAMSMWLIAEQHDLGAAYINPNLANKDAFEFIYGPQYVCCGALAVGPYEGRVQQSPRPSITDILL